MNIGQPLREAREAWVSAFERRYLEELLRQHENRVSAAARAAGVDRIYFYRLLWKHGLRQREPSRPPTKTTRDVARRRPAPESTRVSRVSASAASVTWTPPTFSCGAQSDVDSSSPPTTSLPPIASADSLTCAFAA